MAAQYCSQSSVPPHRARRDCEEVPAILPVDGGLAGQLQVGLVHERRRVERAARPPPQQLPPRRLAQVLIDQADQVVERAAVAGSVATQELRDVFGSGPRAGGVRAPHGGGP